MAGEMTTPLDVRRGLTKASDLEKPLRWGIIGTGGISVSLLIPSFSRPSLSYALLHADSTPRLYALGTCLHNPRTLLTPCCMRTYDTPLMQPYMKNVVSLMQC